MEDFGPEYSPALPKIQTSYGGLKNFGPEYPPPRRLELLMEDLETWTGVW